MRLGALRAWILRCAQNDDSGDCSESWRRQWPRSRSAEGGSLAPVLSLSRLGPWGCPPTSSSRAEQTSGAMDAQPTGAPALESDSQLHPTKWAGYAMERGGGWFEGLFM